MHASKKPGVAYRRAITITHATDIDGIGSAALLKMKYDIPDSRQFFVDYSAEGLERAFVHLRKVHGRGDTLFIADLGLNRGTVKLFSDMIRFVKKNGGHVIWFDHHPWDAEAISSVASACDIAIVGENTRHCATEITYRELGFEDKFTSNFARIVHYSDFNVKPKSMKDRKTIGTYALSIAYYNTMDARERDVRLHRLVNIICSGRLLDAKVRSDARAFERINNERIGKMLGELYLGKRIAVGFSEEIQSTQACAAVMEKSGKDVAVYVNLEKGKGHIRSRIADCSVLASMLGGGGHPHAAGFNIDMKRFGRLKTESDRNGFVDYVDSAAAKYVR